MARRKNKSARRKGKLKAKQRNRQMRKSPEQYQAQRRIRLGNRAERRSHTWYVCQTDDRNTDLRLERKLADIRHSIRKMMRSALPLLMQRVYLRRYATKRLRELSQAQLENPRYWGQLVWIHRQLDIPFPPAIARRLAKDDSITYDMAVN